MATIGASTNEEVDGMRHAIPHSLSKASQPVCKCQHWESVNNSSLNHPMYLYLPWYTDHQRKKMALAQMPNHKYTKNNDTTHTTNCYNCHPNYNAKTKPKTTTTTMHTNNYHYNCDVNNKKQKKEKTNHQTINA